MADSASVTQIVQIGRETTPGAPVAATKRLPNFKIQMSPDGNFSEYRSSGSVFIENVFPGEELSSGSSEGGMSFTDVGYALSSAVARPVTTTVNSVKQHVFTPLALGGDTYNVFTLEKGDASNAFRFAYVVWTGFSMKFSKKEARHSGDLMGRAIGINALTGSVSAAAKQVMVPRNVELYYAATMAGLSAGTKLSRLFEAEFKISNRYIPVFQMDASDQSFATIVQAEPEVSLMLKLGASTSGSDFAEPITLADMRNATINYLRIKALGPGVPGASGGQLYTFLLDMAVVVNKPLKLDDMNGVQGVGAEFRVVNDTTAGFPFQITLINEMTDYQS
jgi:hypothetical protein